MKTWNLVLSGLFLLGLPAMVQAQFTFTTNNDAITITGYTGTNTTVVIPDTTNGWPVTSIGDDAFSSCTNLVSVTISTNVTSLGVESFQVCANQADNTIPDSVTNIGAGAFAWCISLAGITIPSSVTFIDFAAFYNCFDLTEVYFQGNAPDMGLDPFGGGQLAVFANDRNATAFFPPGSTGWDSNFAGLPTWSSYYSTNDGAITIAQYAGFGGAVTIPPTVQGLPVTGIGTNAFAYDSSLTSITIPQGVTNIDDGAFFLCTNLTAFYFQGNAPAIGSSVFYGITNATVYFLPGSTGWGATFAGFTAWALYPFNFTTNDGAITITGYTGGGGAVVIPDTIFGLPVTSIADFAFQYCYGLTSVTIPSSVTYLGSFAFRYDSGLTNVSIPDSITSLNSEVFESCGLVHVTLPDSIKTLAEGVFAYCPLTGLTIPDSVTNIGDNVFSHTSLTNITIPKSVASMGSDVFWSCSNMTAAYFLGNAPSVGSLVWFGENTPDIYYLPGTTGWGPTFGGRPTVLWLPDAQTTATCYGGQTNQFGFNLNWACGQTVVVEASTNLVNWQPVQTNILTTGSAYFSDPQWTNFPGRFYRVRSPQ
jgi:hypothetical protein